MNTQTMVVTLTCLALSVIGGLAYLSNEGSITALIILVVLLTTLLIVLGSILAWLGINLMARQQERQFRDNVSENIQIMKEMQTLQNVQSKGVLQQLGAVARLPQAAPPVDSLMIEDGIFNELEG